MEDCRRVEKATILEYLKRSISTFVYGPEGVGKSTLIREVAKEVTDRFGPAVYVDCSLYPTANAVLREALIALGSVIASKSNYELTKRLKEKTRKGKPTVFLDHFEHLKKHDILSILLGLDFCICVVADALKSHRSMSLDLRARLSNLVKIEKLKEEEFLGIIAENSIKGNDDVIQTVAEKSGGNLTLALNILRSIEANGKNISFEEFDLFTDTQRLSEDNSIILDILSQQNRLQSGELFTFYSQKARFPKSERSFRNFMQELCRQGLVKAIGDKRGRSYQIVKKGLI